MIFMKKIILIYLEEIQKAECRNVMSQINVTALENNEEVPIVNERVKEESADEEVKDTPLILGRSPNIKEQIVKIKDLTTDYGKVALEGKVISTDIRELKNGKTLVMFNVYDGTSTITCKSFIDPTKQDLEHTIDRIKNSTRLRTSEGFSTCSLAICET